MSRTDGPQRFLRIVDQQAYLETASQAVGGPMPWLETDHAEALTGVDPYVDTFGRVLELRVAGGATGFSLLGHRRTFNDGIDAAPFAAIPDLRDVPTGAAADELCELRCTPAGQIMAQERFYWQWMLEQVGPAASVEDRLDVFCLMLIHWQPPRGKGSSWGQSHAAASLLQRYGLTQEDLPPF